MAANQAANRYAGLLLDGEEYGAGPAEPGPVAPPDPGIPNLTDLRVMGTGRTSSVYRAIQTVPHRQVVVNVLHEELTSDAGQRFDRERTVGGELSGQSSVVPVFECGISASGEHYLVMPYYRRGSLARLVAEHGGLGWREAAFLIEPVAVTLAEVHGQGTVHRNLEPGNILLTDFLLPRVAAFGMSLPTGTRSTGATLVTTPFFSAPELAVPLEADPRADVYSLGAILWSMLTGQIDFAGDAMVLAARTATAQARTGRPLAPALVVPDPLRDLIARSMADDPRDRPANAATFVSELRRAVARPNEGGSSVSAATVGAIDLATPRSGAAPTGERRTPAVASMSRSAGSDPANDPGTARREQADSTPGATATAADTTAGPGTGTIDAGTDTGTVADAGPRTHAMIGHGAATRHSANAKARMASALAPTAQAAQTDARYVLMLVGLITVVIMVMVTAAMMAVG